MKKTVLFLSFLILPFFMANSKIIENPFYEVKTNGIDHVVKIELNKEDTRIHVHCTFIPGWWVKFPAETFIQDRATGKKLLATNIIGGEFNKELRMPASGDSTFILIFPPLDKKVKTIDYGEEDKVIVYGISLDGKQKKSQTANNVPENVEKWIEENLSKATIQEPLELSSGQFFNSLSSRIIGYMKGYDPKLDFNTGIIYAKNVITREDYPVVIEIHPDGRFEGELPLIHPVQENLHLNNQGIPFYIEPGQTLGIIIDWEEFLIADRNRNIRYQFKDIDYRGPLATTNKELLQVELKKHDFRGITNAIETMLPDAFKEQQYEIFNENKQKIRTALSDGMVSTKTGELLDAQNAASFGVFLLYYISNRNNAARSKPDNAFIHAELPDDFYNFLQEIRFQDPVLLTAEDYSFFINQFEYCTPFSTVRQNIYANRPRPEKSFIQYVEDLGFELTEDEQTLKAWKESVGSGFRITDENRAVYEQMVEIEGNFQEKYTDHMEKYRELYINALPVMTSEMARMNEWKGKDTVMTNLFRLDPSLFSYDVIKVRSLDHIFGSSDREESERFLAFTEENLSHLYLKSEAKRIFLKNHPEGEGHAAYDLPEGKATEIFREIIDAHKGKILYVDFWATWCGPCVGAIKDNRELREKHKGNPDFDFIFITYDSSPINEYEKFIEEHALENSYRVSEDEYNFLRQLFRFNGIPKYVVIDKQGRVLDDDFRMHNFENSLEDILKRGS